ncbi:MAG: YdeI/OmpD-associated family protein [Pirellulales bacterium]|nr:YdeI/OmpD-associated family protein [Pirellulales bacterium]
MPTESVQPGDRAAWRAWLAHNHQRGSGVWLVIYKKTSGKQTFTFDEAIEEALCFGWIDSKPGKVDEERTKLWFAPRKAGTGWSRPNKERIARMIVAKKMTPVGLAKIQAAQADGSWEKLDAIEELLIPPDLRAALRSRPPAEDNFMAFPRSVKRGILEWIVTAKKADTRARRIEETAQLAAQNKRANQWRG